MVTKFVLAAGLLTLAAKLAVVDATLRARTDDARILNNSNQHYRFLGKKKPNSLFHNATSSSSSSKTLPPFGPDILNGYQSCDDFTADLVILLTESGRTYIKNNLNNYCGYYNPNINNNAYNNYTITDAYSNRRTKQETSYGNNNEKELIQSDGTYIYVADFDRIIVIDLSGKVLANVSVPIPSATAVNQSTSVLLDSIFVNKNTLTVLGTVNHCDKYSFACSYISVAFFYNFNLKTKALDLIKQYNISNAGLTFDARYIEGYTYCFSSLHFGIFSSSLYRCSDRFKFMSAAEYETAAFDYLSSYINNYASKVLAILFNEGANASCENVMKIFNDTVQENGSDIYFVKVSSLGFSDRTSKQFDSGVYFLPYESIYSLGSLNHVTKNSILVAQGYTGGSFLIKFTVEGSTLIPTSVGSLDETVGSEPQYNIDLYDGYYRIASTYKIVVLKEENSQLNVAGHLVINDFGCSDSVHFSNDKCFIITSTNEYTSKLILLNLTSPSNPTLVATELLPFPSSIMQPIENGNYIITANFFVSDFNAAVFTVQLHKVTGKGIQHVGQPSEVILRKSDGNLYYSHSDALRDRHALRYLPHSHKLIMPVDLVYSLAYSTDTEPQNIFSFLVYDVNLFKGAIYIGNVTHHTNAYFPSRSMVFNGDLVTLMGSTIKRTSNVTILGSEKWQLELFDSSGLFEITRPIDCIAPVP